MSAKNLLAGIVGAGVGAGVTYLLTKVKPPADHSALMSQITFSPPMPEANVKVVPVYVGEEKFKNNPEATPHSGWLVIEELRERKVYQAMAFVDLWTISTTPPKIYTVEIVKLERISISFTVFHQSFSIAESSTFDTSGQSPGYWLAQLKETGELGEFI